MRYAGNFILSAILVAESVAGIAKARALRGKLNKLDEELTPETDKLPQALAKHKSKPVRETREPVYIDGLTGEAYY